MNELDVISDFLHLQESYEEAGLSLLFDRGESEAGHMLAVCRENELREHEDLLYLSSIHSAQTYIIGYKMGQNHQAKEQAPPDGGSFLGEPLPHQNGPNIVDEFPDVETDRMSPGCTAAVLTLSPEEAQKEIEDIEAGRFKPLDEDGWKPLAAFPDKG